jgi:hypothetical protein
MHRDFEISQGIYLVQPPHELDLHNCFDFLGFDHSVEQRTLLLRWRRSGGDWVAFGTPSAVTIEFREISEFRFFPRDAELPFTEDDCISTFGHWSDDEWADGVFHIAPNQTPDPKWRTAISFMSGAVIAVQAAFANTRIVA